jgi:hypothetical protein
MSKSNMAILALVVGIFLTGCGGQSPTSQASFDANSDIAAIEDAVKVFQDLSDSAQTDDSVENMVRVASLNPSALDGIEESTSKLLAHIDENWDSIGSGDSPDGLSREVLKEWGEAYLFWITYQRKIQAIGEECLANLETFSTCRIQKLGQTIELEQQATEPLSVVQGKIQAWQAKYANE